MIDPMDDVPKMRHKVLRAFAFDKHGPMYDRDDVDATHYRWIRAGHHLITRTKRMTDEADAVIELTLTTAKAFAEAADELVAQEQRLAAITKKSAGSVRDSVNKLATGVEKMQKAANFDRLERMTILLERSAVALTTLAELEQRGQLKKIAAALNQ